MIKTVEKYIQQFNMISVNDEIIAGVSGGADSVCMLLQLLEYRTKCAFDLKVVHINHLIREDASEDAQFVQKLCEDNDIPFYLFEEDIEAIARENGLSTEEAGRQIRYRRFQQIMNTDNAKIAVAHNRNDVAETVLFNIFRGTGIEGLASLNPVNGNIIRPLIGLTRKEIEEYLNNSNQEYKTDSTNATNDYARNKIRNVILPYAESEIVNGATEHIAELSEKMLLMRDYIKREAKLVSREVSICTKNEAVINCEKLLKLDKVMINEVILHLLDQLTTGRKDIGQVHVEAICELLDKKGEKRVDLPYNLEAVKQYENLVIRPRVENNTGKIEYNLTEDIVLDNGNKIKIRYIKNGKELSIPQNAYTKWFDYDKIIECLKLRNKQPGDYITINNEMKTKSLKDYMIDEKIPREKRDNQLIIADGSHVLWVIGHRISEYYKVSENTKNIIEISFE